MVSSFPKMQKSSASFSQSIRNRLRLKKLQAQAKNFCRVLDIRVPQRMDAARGKISILQEPAERTGKVVAIQRRTHHAGEDRAIPTAGFRALPCSSAFGVILLLLLLLRSEDTVQGLSQRNHPFAGCCFRCAVAAAGTAVVQIFDDHVGSVNVQAILAQVLPAQTAQLADAHSGAKQELQRMSRRRIRQALEQGVLFLGGKGSDFRALHGGHPYRLDGILLHLPQGDGLLQSLTQYLHVPLDGGGRASFLLQLTDKPLNVHCSQLLKWDCFEGFFEPADVAVGGCCGGGLDRRSVEGVEPFIQPCTCEQPVCRDIRKRREVDGTGYYGFQHGSVHCDKKC